MAFTEVPSLNQWEIRTLITLGTPGRIATQFCMEVLLAHRYRTMSIGRYRHLRELRELG